MDELHPITLTARQKEWLNQHGGRDANHLERIGDKYYVWFFHPAKGGELVELPNI